MILYINTGDNEKVSLAIKDKDKIVAQKNFRARYQQAEKLLPEIDKLLRANKIKLNNLKEIIVENQGSSFTALRIGVITANALGFALGIPVQPTKGKALTKTGFSIVKPEYDREPNISC